jgi:hypothetical protein
MNNNDSDNCTIIFYLYYKLKYFEAPISSKIFYKLLTIVTNLEYTDFNIIENDLDLNKIVLVDNSNNKIFIINNFIIVKDKNILKYFIDPNSKLQTLIMKHMSDYYYEEIKYYLEV